jgi:hypothetical protein
MVFLLIIAVPFLKPAVAGPCATVTLKFYSDLLCESLLCALLFTESLLTFKCFWMSCGLFKLNTFLHILRINHVRFLTALADGKLVNSGDFGAWLFSVSLFAAQVTHQSRAVVSGHCGCEFFYGGSSWLSFTLVWLTVAVCTHFLLKFNRNNFWGVEMRVGLLIYFNIFFLLSNLWTSLRFTMGSWQNSHACRTTQSQEEVHSVINEI